MGDIDDNRERAGGPVDLEMAHFIRAEIKVAVQDQVQETLNAPPSYDSSAPLLMASTMGDEDDIEEAQQQTASSGDKCASILMQCKNLLAVFAILFPFFGTFSLVPIIIASGMDPLGFSGLAALLMLSLLVFIMIQIFVVRSLTLYIA